MTTDFWQGKRVFLTGHTGFKGGWLSMWLKLLGAQVTGYSLAPPSTTNLYMVANVANSLDSVIGDVRDFAALQAAMQAVRPEIVIHMAAQALVRHSYANPLETYSTNVMGTVHLLEAVRNTPSVRAVVNVTSDKCYENREWIWSYRENEPMGGYDPYSNSKGCAELVTAAYRSSYFNASDYAKHGVAIATARAGNVIGGGDWAPDRLIPDFMRAIVADETVVIRSPNAVRPWQHVLEPLSGYLLLAEKLYQQGTDYAQAWNFGPQEGEAKPVQWIADAMVKSWGEGFSYRIEQTASNLHEANYLKLDCTKARENLGWQAKWTLAKTIDEICVWHKAHLAGDDMQQICLNQIKQYQAT